MSWDALEVIFNNYPQFRGEIDKLKEYIVSGDLYSQGIDTSHVSASTGISEKRLKNILEKGVELGTIQKEFRLECPRREGFLDIEEKPDKFPITYFCDLCGEEHIFHSDNFKEIYLLSTTVSHDKKENVISEEKMESIRSRMPLLGYFSNKLMGSGKHYKNITFLIILHFLEDLLVFIESCEKLGLEPSKSYLFWKDYRYPHKEVIISTLKTKGYNISPLNDLEEVLKKIEESNQVESIMIIEDGGYITPIIHSTYPKALEKTIASVEQTTRGIRSDKDIKKIKMPILSIAEASIKNEIEPPHVADAVVKNISNIFDHEKLRGSSIAVMGYGTIGREIAKRLSDMGANVTIFDPNAESSVVAKEKGRYITVKEAYNAVKDKLLVVGCSGETSVSHSEILNLAYNTYLVSASSDQREIGLEELEALSGKKEELKIDNKNIGTTYYILKDNKPVHLIADGYPINFWFSDSMPNQVSDLILTLIFLATFEAVKNTDSFDKGIQGTDDIAGKYRVAELYSEHY